jgi:hypothetical protein
MGIVGSRFNWKPQASAWQQLQQQRERHKAMREDFEGANAMASNTLNTLMADTVSAAGELAAKRALTRIQAEAQAKLKAEAAEASADSVQIWKNKTPPKQLTVGNTRINLATNTLTLSDGTVINTKTGVKTVPKFTATV